MKIPRLPFDKFNGQTDADHQMKATGEVDEHFATSFEGRFDESHPFAETACGLAAVLYDFSALS